MSQSISVLKPQEISILQRFGLFIALAALVGLMLIPAPTGLPVAGQRMLALLVFSVILWMTEGVSYPVSAAIIASLMTFPIGTSPHAETVGKFYTTTEGLTMALGGFANTAWALLSAQHCFCPPP